jgi:hypothetical protein
MEIKGLINSIGTTLRFLFSPMCPMWLQTGRLATGNWATGTSVFYRVLCMCPIVPYVVPAFYLLLFSIVSYVPYVVATFYLLPSTFYCSLLCPMWPIVVATFYLLPSTFYLLLIPMCPMWLQLYTFLLVSHTKTKTI